MGKHFLLTTVIYFYTAITGVAHATDLVVQSRAITDLYGSAFIEHLGIKDAILLERQARQPDVAQVVKSYVHTEKFDKVILLGQFYSIDETKHIPVFTQFVLPASIVRGPIYVLQGASKLEEERKNVIEKQAKIDETFNVETEYDLRKALAALRSLPRGFIIINVFSLRDNWGEKRSYKSIEEIVVSSNSKHVDVGVCYKGFRTAVALGPTPDDIDTILKGENSSSLCATLPRLIHLGRLDLYLQQSGSFYHVNPNSN